MPRPDGAPLRPESSSIRPDGAPIRSDTVRPPGTSAPSRPGTDARALSVSRPVSPATHGARPTGAVRPYDRSTAPARPTRPPQYSSDHRYARPSPASVRPSPRAYAPPPQRPYYRPYYTRWYVHPWYRWTYATSVVVGFGFYVDPWSPLWAPPLRPGWGWIPGAWVGPAWFPGYFQPVGPVPLGYAWVPGWWDGNVYVEGWWRPQQRADGDWVWVEGQYLEGAYQRGHWAPARSGPDGYVWEPGFWDGESWVEGFWRPRYRNAFTWVSAWFDEDGIFHAGYWAPTTSQPGQVWIPGWFDGNRWVEGYWVPDTQYQSEDVSRWQPDEGWNDGWSSSQPQAPTVAAEAALGLPADVSVPPR